MMVRIGLLGSGFVAEFYLQGLRHVANWEIPLVYSPHKEHARAFVERWNVGRIDFIIRHSFKPLPVRP